MSSHPGEDAGPRRTLADLAKREVLRFVVLFLYLWAMFLLFELHQYVVLATYQIPFENWGFGFLNALVLAKVMVVADEVRMKAFLRSKPLIVPVAARSLAFAILFIAVDIAEKVLVGAFHGKGIAESIPNFGGGGLLGRIVVAIIIAVALMPFFAFEEIDLALGRGRLGELLFKRGLAANEGATRLQP
jgi:hypothetical protein